MRRAHALIAGLLLGSAAVADPGSDTRQEPQVDASERARALSTAVAALPSIAVAANGTLGVLYTTYEGRSARRPRFTTHLAQSSDGGASFTDRALLSFVSPAASNARSAQRVLGDYQQVRAVGDDFFVAFPANGAAAGRSIESIDPFFARLPAAPPTP